MIVGMINFKAKSVDWPPVAIYLALTVLGVFFETQPARAETELEKLTSTIPPKARFEFTKYRTCALTAYIEQKNDGAPFSTIRERITESCKKDIEAAGMQLRTLGMSAVETVNLQAKYEALSFQEYALMYDGKPIPGYQVDPWTKSLVDCTNSNRENVSRYYVCADQALRGLLPFSDDPSDVIADAVIGICESVKSQFVRSATKCIDHAQVQSLAANLTAKLRSSILGKVAALRAEAKRRQLMPSQPTNPPLDRKPLDQGI